MAVVGAGVLGLMCALRLAQTGARVTLYEATPDRANASTVAAGMIAPATECALDPALRAFAHPLRAARAAWTKLAAELGVGLEAVGVLNTGPAPELMERKALLQRLGFTASTPAPHSPAAGDDHRPLFTPEDAALDTGHALRALRQAAVAAGVDVRGGRVERGLGGPEAGGEPIAAEALVLATGAPGRHSDLAPELALLTPIKGQLLRWANPHGARGPILRTPSLYLVTVPDAIVAGATMEPGRDDLDPDPALLAPLRAEAQILAPALADLPPPTAHVGVRADTPDGLPLVGPSQTPGVFLATGARRNGWLWAPLVADIVTAQVLGRPLCELAPLADRLHPARLTTRETT